MAENNKQSGIAIYMGLFIAIVGLIGTIVVAIINNPVNAIRVQNEINLTNTAIIKTDIAREATQVAQQATAMFTITPSDSPTNTIEPSETPQLLSPSTAPSNPAQPIIPTNTTTPQPSHTSAPMQITRAYPCNAQVDPNAASSVLNVVRQFPSQSEQIVAGVRRGDIVVIVDISTTNSIFYQIQINNRPIGWIPAEYLVLSDDCPN